jgi:hypothetical protein
MSLDDKAHNLKSRGLIPYVKDNFIVGCVPGSEGEKNVIQSGYTRYGEQPSKPGADADQEPVEDVLVLDNPADDSAPDETEEEAATPEEPATP